MVEKEPSIGVGTICGATLTHVIAQIDIELASHDLPDLLPLRRKTVSDGFGHSLT